MMNKEQIAALKAAAEAATPGPWWAGHCDPADGNALAWIGQWFVDSEHREPTFGRKVYKDQRADAEYITQANPQAILALIKRMEAAEKDACRWNTISTLMFIGNVELSQEEDGGYIVKVDPVENIVGRTWSGNTPEEVIDVIAGEN